MDEQNNAWLTVTSTKDIQKFLSIDQVIENFLSAYSQLGKEFTVSISEMADEQHHIPASGNLNYKGVTVALFDFEVSEDAGENRFLSIGIVDANIYFSRVFALGRSCIEYFNERLNSLRSVSRYCNDAVGLLSLVVSKWPNQVIGALQIDMFKTGPSAVSVTTQFSFDDDADRDNLRVDVSFIQRFIYPYQSQIPVSTDDDEQFDASLPAMQVIVHTNPDELSQDQQEIIDLIRETATDLNRQRQANTVTEKQLLPASCGQFYDGSAVNTHVVAAFTRTLEAEVDRLTSIITQLPEKYYKAVLNGHSHINRAYEQPFDINVTLPQADGTPQALISIRLDDHQLTDYRHFSRFATLVQTQQLAQQPKELQLWAHQAPAALIGSAAIDLIVDRIGAIKLQLEQNYDQLGLTVIPKIDYDPLNQPADYDVSALIVPSELSIADYDSLDDSQILGAMHFRKHLGNAELNPSDLTADRLGTKMTALELSSRANLSQRQVNALINLYMLAIDSFDGTGLIDMPSEDDVREGNQIDPSQMGTASVDQVAKEIHDELNHNNDHHDSDDDAADDQDD